MVSKGIQEKYLSEKLNPIFEELGFKLKKSGIPKKYLWVNNGIRIEMQFQLSTLSKYTYMTNFFIHFEHIEEVILKAEYLPRQNMDAYKKKKLFFNTIYDHLNTQTLFTRTNPINIESDLFSWVQNVEDYIKGDGLDFLNNNSSLRSIFNMANQIYNNNGDLVKFFSGGGSMWYRFLILSHLNSDESFFDKVEFVKKIFSSQTPPFPEWQKALEEFLPIILKTPQLSRDELEFKRFQYPSNLN